VIEIVGCNGKNIGDILMLEAAIQELRLRHPKAAFAVRRRSILQRVKAEDRLNFLPLVRPGARRRQLKERTNGLLLGPFSALAGLYPGLAAAHRVTGIVDVCGYKYGGIWGRSAIDSDLREYAREKRKGRRIVLLPKTFGPFADPATEAAMRELVELCDLCYCRDQLSHDHLTAAGVPAERCPVFPDFTTTVKGVADARYQAYAGRPLIIPNFRMVDSGRGLDEAGYAALLESLTTLLRRRGMEPLLVVHDAGRDLAFSQELARKNDLSLVLEKRAAAVKGLIGQAGLVYSDRLHGLINALSQTVPALTSGWNFKYAEALKNYGMERMLITPDERQESSLQTRLDRLLAEEKSLREQLSAAAGRLKQTNGLMWDQVNRCLFFSSSLSDYPG